MPDIEGITFAPYEFQPWPMPVVRSDGATILAMDQAEVDAFLQGAPSTGTPVPGSV